MMQILVHAIAILRDYFFMDDKYVSWLYYSILKDEFFNINS